MLCLAAATICSGAHWKVAVLSDTHVNVNYQNNITADTYCEKSGSTKMQYTDVIAPLGRMGCDPPVELLQRFLDRMKEGGAPDVLFMPGDFIGHSIPVDKSKPMDEARY